VLKKRLLFVILLLVLISITLFFGSAPPSPFYYLKITRETIQTNFIFGTEDKANWLLTRADKRLTEAQKLKSKGFNALAETQIQTAIDYQKQSEILLLELKDKTNTTYLTDRYNQNSDKIKQLSGE